MGENKVFLKGNLSSNDNTLAFPHFNPITNKYAQPVEPRLSHQRQNPTPDTNLISEYNKIMNSNFDTSNRIFPQMNNNSNQDLDKQVADHQSKAKALKLTTDQNDLELIKHYPFGARTDPSSYLNHNNNSNNSYQMNSHNVNGHPLEFRANQDRNYKYDRNNIVEKPNSLNSDLPSYDPIKYRYGASNSNNYDPWGKPGGGAPLIDNGTGKKSTKISGQVWYDKIGVFPDERQKHYSDKVRVLPIDEQKRLMEEEISRKRDERDSIYKPFLDVSSWISGFERQPLKYGAHLNHTNVTREKMNVETVRRNDNPLLSNSYHRELGKQMEEKERQKKLSKLKEDVAGIEHTRKWDKMWGRPGAGAPNGTERRKRNVIGTLESPRVGYYDPTYGGKSLAMSDSYVNDNQERDKQGNLLYTRTIKHSNHTNLYDNEPPLKVVN